MAAEKTPDDFDFEVWSLLTKTTLIEKGLWEVVENGVPPNPSKITPIQAEELSRWKDLAAKDKEALQVIRSSLTESVLKKTLSSSSAKEVWDLLEKDNEEAKKLDRLEKRFNELRMDEGESEDSLFDRVNEIAIQLRGSKYEKKEYQILTRALTSFSRTTISFDGMASAFEELIDVHKMNCISIIMFFKFRGYESLREEDINLLLEQKRLEAKYNHKLVDDFWMLYRASTIPNHMTPDVKYFTALDRRYKEEIGLSDGRVTMVEGKGDVKIVMKDGKKKTIKNVWFVPELNRNLLSFRQLESRGYSFSKGRKGECVIRDRTGTEFGESMPMFNDNDENGLAFLFNVVQGNLTS